MVDFDRNFDRRSSGRGRSDRRSGGFGGRGGGSDRGRFGGSDRGRFGGSDRGRFGGSDRGRDRRSERHEMHETVCDKCGKDCEVPFKPTEGKPVYCDNCYKNKSREVGSKSEFGKPKSDETFEQLHKKLDRILKILEEPIIEKDVEEPKAKSIIEKDVEEPKAKSIEKEEPELEYAQDIEKKKPKKKKAKKKK